MKQTDFIRTRPETVFTGLPVSRGIAIGPAYLVRVDHPRVPHRSLAEEDVVFELARFERTVLQSIDELNDLKQSATQLPGEGAEEAVVLLEAHLAMLRESRLVRGVRTRISQQKINAELAVEREVSALAQRFAALKDSYIAARIDDVRAVGNRLIRILMNLPYMALESVPQGGIVLAREITPADTALLDPRRFAGIATVYGGAAGHTAVMARGLGLPAVLGVSEGMMESVHQGDMAVVDGFEGKLVLNPRPETLEAYRTRAGAEEQERKDLGALSALPAQTRDGTEVILRANLEMPREIESVVASGAKGIGLFRTEFLYMNRDDLPSVEEQAQILTDVVRKLDGMPMTVRTLDIGGDKLAHALGSYMSVSSNPALGLRAIRLSLREPQILMDQFSAILRAAVHGDIRILLPMITTASEVTAARRILKSTYAQLKEQGVQVPEKLPPLGAMIEIPAAALAADTLATVSDFFALGTNDLIQYTVAIDRGNDQVADLYNPLNPAVLRLIEFTVQAAERSGIPVSICGEMAADPLYTPVLLGLGLRDFSMGYASISRVKSRIRHLDMGDVAAHTEQVMNEFDPDQIIQLVKQKFDA